MRPFPNARTPAETAPSRVIAAITVTGFSGIVGQMILLRELLIVCSGNELSIGIILANWLILEAFGSFIIGKRAERSKHPLGPYGVYMLLFSLLLPAMIYAARMMRATLGLSIAEGIGILPVIGGSFVILLPVAILHGALFTYGCRVYAACTERDASAAGKAYVYETIGTVLGGIAWTYLFIPYIHTWHMAAGIAVLNFLICTVLLLPHARGKLRWYRAGAVLSLVLLIAAAGFILGGFVQRLHQRSAEVQWHPQNLVHYENSRYSNIGVTERDGQYAFFLDGVPHIITPIPDILHVEKFVHIPLLSHKNPARLLILSGGAGGVIHEVLKHPTIQSVDYSELDPKVIEMLRKYPTPLTEQELNDPRVNVSHIDGRLFLKTAQDSSYDIILVGIREPSDLQANRFFTHEFFSLALKRLDDQGILVFSVPGSLTYLSKELRNLNSSVYHTASDVFPFIRVIPGEGSNLFLASRQQDIIAMDVDRFAQHAVERDFRPEVLVPRHIQQTLHPGWMRWFEEFIQDSSQKRNLDFSPIGVYHSISHWNAVYAPSLRGIFSWFGDLALHWILLGCTAVLLSLLLLRRQKANRFGSGIPPSLCTTGFSGMVLDLTLIFAFQALYGYVFAWIGLLVTAFMAGSACGAQAVTAKLRYIKEPRKVFIGIDLIIMGFTLALPLTLILLRPLMETPAVFHAFRIGILMLSFISGVLIGAQFPLANRLYLESSGNVSRTAGLLYGSDLFGGWVGGMVGGVILLPVLGLAGTCIAAAALKACSFVLLIPLKQRTVQEKI